MTPDEVLDLLRYNQVLFEECDEESDDISGDTSVYDWFERSDDGQFSRAWVATAGTLNMNFGIDVPLNEWKNILNPPRQRRLADVCRFVAKRATVPDIPIPRILGTPCRSAGAFHTVRKLLAAQGAVTSGLTPSSPLSEYAANGMPEIGMDLIRMSPSLAVRSVFAHRGEGGYLLLGLLLLAATFASGAVAVHSFWPAAPLTALAFGAFVAIWRSSEKRVEKPYRLDFVGLHNFKDLCGVLAHPETSLPFAEIRDACEALRWSKYPPGHCWKCGYNLTGNISGRCSECGKPTSSWAGTA